MLITNSPTRPTKIGGKGINLIKSFEGFRGAPYLCPAGVPTIGYGAINYESGARVTLYDPVITEGRAVELLLHELKFYELSVDAMTRDDISQNQFDALVSFAYNLGTSALKGSTLLKKLNKNPQDPTIRAEFAKWVRAGKKILPGLIKRREAEANLYFS